MNVFSVLLRNIEALPVIDSHEHFRTETGYLNATPDFFDLLSPYVVDTLMAAGMSHPEWQRLCDKNRSLEERWSLLCSRLPDIRHTNTFRALEISMEELYGLSIKSCGDIQEISKSLREDMRPGIFDRVLKTRHIVKSCTFVEPFGTAAYRDSFVEPIPTVSDFIPRDIEGIELIERWTGIRVRNLDSLGQAIDSLFDYYRTNRIRALKFGSGYRRVLDFAQPDSIGAERILNKIICAKTRGDDLMLGRRGQTMSSDDVLLLDDWISERFFSLAEDADMPVIFHVAMHAWLANNPEYAHAHYLTDMLFRHPRLRVEILHSGAPFVDEAILLARYFPLVSLNLTWTHVIDRSICRKAVRSFVEALPVSKVTAFGGDCFFPQQVPGHLKIARENLAHGLLPLIEDSTLTSEAAVDIARRWLYDNPLRFFGLEPE